MTRRLVITAVVAALALFAAAVVVVGVVIRPDRLHGPTSAQILGGSAPAVVRTDRGQVAGFEHDGIVSWRGIPYAAPPVGALRWRPPAPAPGWDDVRPADTYAPRCLQAEPSEFGSRSLAVDPASSEDCLYLNVNRPLHQRGSLPVLVWIHGGGFVLGTGNGGAANSAGMVQRGVVVVTLSYRLGRFGFFAHPSLGGSVANYGLLDQVAALRWVRDNIEEFGGDPDRVTIAGVSAGGMSVNALMSSPVAGGLFAGAISQSGLGNEQPRTLDDARAQGVEAFPDSSADQLRDLPAARLLSSTFNVFAGDAPILDDVLPVRVAEVFAAGREAAVPYLVGTTDAEFSDVDLASFGVRTGTLRAGLGGARHGALLAAYGRGAAGRAAYDDDVLDDVIFGAPALTLAQEHARTAAAYRYRFAVDPRGSVHGAEVPYVFDAPPTPDDASVAHQVADMWAAFVTTGRPSVSGLPVWPDAADGSLMELTPRGPQAMAVDPWRRRLDAVTQLVHR